MAKGLYNFMFKAPSEEKQNNNLNNQLSYDNGGPGDPPYDFTKTPEENKKIQEDLTKQKKEDIDWNKATTRLPFIEKPKRDMPSVRMSPYADYVEGSGKPTGKPSYEDSLLLHNISKKRIKDQLLYENDPSYFRLSNTHNSAIDDSWKEGDVKFSDFEVSPYIPDSSERIGRMDDAYGVIDHPHSSYLEHPFTGYRYHPLEDATNRIMLKTGDMPFAKAFTKDLPEDAKKRHTKGIDLFKKPTGRRYFNGGPGDPPWDPYDWRTWKNVDRRVSSAASSSRGKGTSAATPDVNVGTTVGPVDNDYVEPTGLGDLVDAALLDSRLNNDSDVLGDDLGDGDLFGGMDVYPSTSKNEEEEEEKLLNFNWREGIEDQERPYLEDLKKKQNRLFNTEALGHGILGITNSLKRYPQFQPPEKVVAPRVRTDTDKAERVGKEGLTRNIAAIARNAQEMGGTPYAGAMSSANIPRYLNQIYAATEVAKNKESFQNAQFESITDRTNSANLERAKQLHAQGRDQFNRLKGMEVSKNMKAFTQNRYDKLREGTVADQMIMNIEDKNKRSEYTALNAEKMMKPGGIGYISEEMWMRLDKKTRRKILDSYAYGAGEGPPDPPTPPTTISS